MKIWLELAENTAPIMLNHFEQLFDGSIADLDCSTDVEAAADLASVDEAASSIIHSRFNGAEDRADIAARFDIQGDKAERAADSDAVFDAAADSGNAFFITSTSKLIPSSQSPSLGIIDGESTESRESIIYIALQRNPQEHYQLQEGVINAGVGRLKEYDLQQKQHYWRAAGLTTSEQLAHERLYLVHCIDFVMLSYQRVSEMLEPIREAMIVERNEHDVIVASPGQELSEQTQRVLETNTTRALYALMVDIGSVLVAVSGTGSIAIREAWSIEQRSLPIDRTLIRSALLNWYHYRQHYSNDNILIGADPEFIMLDDKQQVVKASHFFLNHGNEGIGVDAIRIEGKIIHPIVEIRPEPSDHPKQLFNAIHRLLVEANERVAARPFRWLAGAMPIQGLALGGHLHYSGIHVTPRLLRLFDLYLAIPFAAVADIAGSGRYRKYGGLGDYRKQYYGGFEYRTLPSWLISPALTRSAINIGWLIIKDQHKLFSESQDFIYGELSEAYVMQDRATLVSLAEQLLLRFSSVPRNEADTILAEQAIKPLQAAIEQGNTWNERKDFRKRWNIGSGSSEYIKE